MLTVPEDISDRILQLTDIAIIACNAVGTIIQCNNRAATLFGYAENELLGLSVHQLVPPALRERHAGYLQNFLASAETIIPMGNRGTVVGYRKDGTAFAAEASLSKFPIYDVGGGGGGCVPHCDEGMRPGTYDNWIMLVSLHDISSKRQQEDQAAWLANHDALTGLSNRALMIEHINCAIEHSQVHGSHIALLLIGIDGLSTVNDVYGTPAGDRLLVTISERLLRAISNGDVVARLEGKTFVILREPCNDVDEVAALATRVNDVVRQPLAINGQRVFLTASIGLVVGGGTNCLIYGEHTPLSAQDLLRDADIAMRYVKETGRDHWRLFTADLQTQAQRRNMISSGLRTALEQEQFSIRLHPIVKTSTGDIKGAELLLRWQPEGGPISPDEFIPLAERDATIVPIGLWVFEQACRIAAHLRDNYGKQAPYISVNVSARQLGDPLLAEKFSQRLDQHGLKSTSIIIELTETGIMTDMAANIQVLNQLANLGLRIAVDDFGTGYSSLLQLLKLPISIIKIDKAFVSGIEQRGEHYTIVDSVLRMSRALRLNTIAEGVEQQAQVELLRELGCDFLQGYYFSKPLDEIAFMELIAKQGQQPLAAIGEVFFTIYTSIASQGLQSEDMSNILKRAQARNAKLHITGCLLYLNGEFMQYLEGPEESVKAILASIRKDPHHYAMRDIATGSLHRRLFRYWHMSFGNMTDEGERGGIPLSDGGRGCGCVPHVSTDVLADPWEDPPLPHFILAEHLNTGEGFATIAANPWLAYNLFKVMSLGLAMG